MVRRCTVQGCNRAKEMPCKTYGIPAIRKNEEATTSRRQNLWLKRLNLFGKKISIKNVCVCDAHFLSGKHVTICMHSVFNVGIIQESHHITWMKKILTGHRHKTLVQSILFQSLYMSVTREERNFRL